jgi:hypothetical protein
LAWGELGVVVVSTEASVCMCWVPLVLFFLSTISFAYWL